MKYLWKKITSRMIGTARRIGVAAALRGALGALGVTVEAAEELPAIHLALDSFGEFIADPAARSQGRTGKARQSHD